VKRWSKVVIIKRGHKYAHGLSRNWDTKFCFDWADIPNNLELTPRAISHWKKTKSPLGYANFKTLRQDDVVSILSGAKNSRLTMINVNRQGDIAYYKIK